MEAGVNALYSDVKCLRFQLVYVKRSKRVSVADAAANFTLTRIHYY